MDLLLSENSGGRRWRSRKSRGKVLLKGLEPKPGRAIESAKSHEVPGVWNRQKGKSYISRYVLEYLASHEEDVYSLMTCFKDIS